MRPGRAEPLDSPAALLGVVTVLLANGLYLSGLLQVVDPVPTSMEPYFIDMARRPVVDILRENPAWGPLYALWLKPFRMYLGDPLLVYAANVYALALVTSLAIYAYLLLSTRRASVAAAAAMFFVVSDLNVPLGSKVCAFAAMVVLLGLAMSQLFTGAVARLSVVSVGVFSASYARPELYPAALFLWLAAAWRSRIAGTSRGTRVWVVAAGLLFATLGIAHGTPLWSRQEDNDRLFAAVREHFAWNWAEWNGHSQYFRTVWELEFGGAETLLQSISTNPEVFLRHLGENFVGTMRFLAASTFDHRSVVSRVFGRSPGEAENLSVALLCFAAMVVVLASRRYRTEFATRFGDSVLVMCVLVWWPLAAAIVIYPSPHYLLLPALALVLAAALVYSLLLPSALPTSAWLRGLIVACSLALIPRPFYSPIAEEARPVTETVTHIRSLGLQSPVHVLSMTDGIGELLGDGFEEIKIWGRNDLSLEEYIRAEHVDVIVTMERGRYSFVVDDPYWQTIQLTPEATGFRLSSASPDESARIWVRSEPTP